MQCLQYVFYICIICTQYEMIRYVWRDIKTIPRPQKFYRAGAAPKVQKFLYLPLSIENVVITYCNIFHQLNCIAFDCAFVKKNCASVICKNRQKKWLRWLIWQVHLLSSHKMIFAVLTTFATVHAVLYWLDLA